MKLGDTRRVEHFAVRLIDAGFSCRAPQEEKGASGHFIQELKVLQHMLQKPDLDKMLFEMPDPDTIRDTEYKKTTKFVKINGVWFGRVELTHLPSRHQGVLTVLRDELGKKANPEILVVTLHTDVDETPDGLKHVAQNNTAVLVKIFESLASLDFPVDRIEGSKTRFGHLGKVNALRHEAFLELIANAREK